jgi:hypothetical protein
LTDVYTPVCVQQHINEFLRCYLPLANFVQREFHLRVVHQGFLLGDGEMEESISISYVVLSKINEFLKLINTDHMWVVYAVKRLKISFLLFNQCTLQQQQLTTNFFIHCNFQTSHTLLSMATTVVKQKGKVKLIVEQYMEAIDTVFNLEIHVVSSPVPFVTTKFKCVNER